MKEHILLEDRTPILNVQTLKNINQLDVKARLFYEIGYKINYKLGVDNDNWVKTGYFKEIQNPIEYIGNDKRMVEECYLNHHNFKFKNPKKNKQ